MGLKILHFGHDTALSKSLQAYSPRTVNGLQVFPASTYEKFISLLEKESFDAILVEAFNDKPLPENWISLLTKKHPNLKEPARVAFLYIAATADDGLLRTVLDRGYTDLIAPPVDLSILLQKLQLYMRDKRFLKENLLFALDAKESCEISISGQIVKAAEYGATILTDREFPLDQVITIFSPIVSDDEVPKPILARVVATAKSGEAFLIAVAFLGSTKKDLTSIRVWLRKNYVSMSGAAGGNPR